MISCGCLGAFRKKPLALGSQLTLFADELGLRRCLCRSRRFLLRGLLGVRLHLVKTSFINQVVVADDGPDDLLCFALHAFDEASWLGHVR